MIKHLTNSSSTTEFCTNSESLSDEALDSVVGGINPQPLPPRAFGAATVVAEIERWCDLTHLPIRNITMSNSKAKLSLREALTATTDEGRIELTERDLSQAGGGIIRRVGDTIKYSPWKIDVAQF
jgi:hypothetical protein